MTAVVREETSVVELIVMMAISEKVIQADANAPAT
jgi:hypothetical protein